MLIVLKVYERLVSKDAVVLRRWGSEGQKIVLLITLFRVQFGIYKHE